MNKIEVIGALKENNLELLEKEAIKRGYVTGTHIDYGTNIKSTILGDDDYDIYIEEENPRLIKWDGNKFDVLFEEADGWVKIIK